MTIPKSRRTAKNASKNPDAPAKVASLSGVPATSHQKSAILKFPPAVVLHIITLLRGSFSQNIPWCLDREDSEGPLTLPANHRQWVRATKVCKAWRDAALSPAGAHLWATLLIKHKDHSWAAEMLQRSNKALLTVVVDLHAGGKGRKQATSVDTTLAALGKHLERCRELVFMNMGHARLKKIYVPSAQFWNLESLRIECKNAYESSPLKLDDRTFKAPKLQTLVLKEFQPGYSAKYMKDLRHLSIRKTSRDKVVGWKEFLGHLSSMPQLESLDYQNESIETLMDDDDMDSDLGLTDEFDEFDEFEDSEDERLAMALGLCGNPKDSKGKKQPKQDPSKAPIVRLEKKVIMPKLTILRYSSSLTETANFFANIDAPRARHHKLGACYCARDILSDDSTIFQQSLAVFKEVTCNPTTEAVSEGKEDTGPIQAIRLWNRDLPPDEEIDEYEYAIHAFRNLGEPIPPLYPEIDAPSPPSSSTQANKWLLETGHRPSVHMALIFAKPPRHDGTFRRLVAPAITAMSLERLVVLHVIDFRISADEWVEAFGGLQNLESVLVGQYADGFCAALGRTAAIGGAAVPLFPKLQGIWFYHVGTSSFKSSSKRGLGISDSLSGDSHNLPSTLLRSLTARSQLGRPIQELVFTNCYSSSLIKPDIMNSLRKVVRVVQEDDGSWAYDSLMWHDRYQYDVSDESCVRLEDFNESMLI